jgi:preprotein translocase subunit SecF
LLNLQQSSRSLTLASIFFIVTKGLKLGLDFTGGISAELTIAAVQSAR